MDTHHTPPIVVALDDADEPADVIDALVLGPFVAGRQPAARSVGWNGFALTQRWSR